MHSISHGPNPGWTLSERVVNLEVWAFGATGSNGANGALKAMQTSVSDQQDDLDEVSTLMLQIRTIWRTVQWIGLGMAAILGPTITSTLGQSVTAALKHIGN